MPFLRVSVREARSDCTDSKVRSIGASVIHSERDHTAAAFASLGAISDTWAQGELSKFLGGVCGVLFDRFDGICERQTPSRGKFELRTNLPWIEPFANPPVTKVVRTTAPSSSVSVGDRCVFKLFTIRELSCVADNEGLSDSDFFANCLLFVCKVCAHLSLKPPRRTQPPVCIL